jgi:hypothetical protein
MIVLNQSLLQVDPLNYLGVTFSIISLLAAGYLRRKSNKKEVENPVQCRTRVKMKFFHRKVFNRRDDQKISVSKEPSQQDAKQFESSEQLEPKKEEEPIIESSPIQRSNKMLRKTPEPSAISNAHQKQIDTKDQAGVSQEIAAECLTCPNLVGCKYWQKGTDESRSSCPFAK